MHRLIQNRGRGTLLYVGIVVSSVAKQSEFTYSLSQGFTQQLAIHIAVNDEKVTVGCLEIPAPPMEKAAYRIVGGGDETIHEFR